MQGGSKSPHKLFLGFCAPESNQQSSDECNDVITEENNMDDEECLQGLVVGPETSRIIEAKRFRSIWAGGIQIMFKLRPLGVDTPHSYFFSLLC